MTLTTRSMTKRAVAAAAIAAIATLGSAPALAAEPPGPPTQPPSTATPTAPKVHRDGDAITLELLARSTTETYYLTGKTPTTTEPGPDYTVTPGDFREFTEDLLQDGVLVGRSSGGCTFITTDTARCTISQVFPNGALLIDDTLGPTDERPLRVTGGTGAFAGAFAGAHGTLLVGDDLTGSDAPHTYTVTTAPVPSDSQVGAGRGRAVGWVAGARGGRQRVGLGSVRSRCGRRRDRVWRAGNGPPPGVAPLNTRSNTILTCAAVSSHHDAGCRPARRRRAGDD